LNLCALGGLLLLLAPTGQTAQETISLDELRYGAVDLNGDGEYTKGDDIALEWLLRENPSHVQEALKTGQRNADGGVDLSPYLLSVTPAGSR
jgi:hypothetical protein